APLSYSLSSTGAVDITIRGKFTVDGTEYLLSALKPAPVQTSPCPHYHRLRVLSIAAAPW
ncbi:MAG TPA: hypothetical protein PL044_06780, partial [Clostridiales bacterium]|nr:hypothetical protein [Clostridiales bacterium]HQK73463.1 hypothetical protein [Clostridiales bacterium]